MDKREFEDELYDPFCKIDQSVVCGLLNGTLTERDILELTETFITSYECGTTLRIGIYPTDTITEEITKEFIWKTIPGMDTIKNIHAGMTDEDVDEELYWDRFIFGKYDIISAGIPA